MFLSLIIFQGNFQHFEKQIWSTSLEVLGMWPCQLKIGWREAKTRWLKIGWREVKTCWFGSPQEFWPSSFAQLVEAGKRGNTQFVEAGKRGNTQQSSALAREECSKYYVTAVLPVSSDWWARWFTSNSLAPICSPNFSFMGGVAQENCAWQQHKPTLL